MQDQKRNNSRYRMIDLFSGAGGLSLGLTAAGFGSVLAFDTDEYACKTYENNIGQILKTDLCQISVADICEHAGIRPGGVHLVCGGPPCQGFSVQRRGKREDRRNDLVVTFAKLAVGLKPALILIENVPGLLGVRGADEYKRVCATFALNGYQVKSKVLNAVDFGVPQFRTRAIIVAWRSEQAGEFRFPLPSHDERHRRTVRDAIGDMPEPPLDYSEHPTFANHIRVRISALNQLRISHVPPGGGRVDIPEELQLPCHKNANGHRHLDVFGRLHWDRPAGTITAMFDNFTRGRFAHPDHDRSITAREGARLQSFPDAFKFVGPKKDVARQIGNAVPPVLAEAVGRQLIAALERRDSEDDPQPTLAWGEAVSD